MADDLRTGNRVSSGYATRGCPTLRTVRTPNGLARATSAKTQAGTWRWDVDHNLNINCWSTVTLPTVPGGRDLLTSHGLASPVDGCLKPCNHVHESRCTASCTARSTWARA